MSNNKDNVYDDVFSKVPRTPEEMQELKNALSKRSKDDVMAKAASDNTKIENAKKMLVMFETETFKVFWEQMHTELLKFIEVHPKDIQGNPFEKLDRLALIQGGFQVLESQSNQKKRIEQIAKGKIVNLEELKATLELINK